ncbi:MAG: hypothetical protein JO317_07090 [Verrucomicrobiae bacterium]|nr:hypothetical protein [Verrucomicrobiae bacterium]
MKKRLLCLSCGLGFVLLPVACSKETAKPPPPASYRVLHFQKATAWIDEGVLYGYFSLFNEKNQEMGVRGALKVTFSALSRLSVQGGAPFEVDEEIHRAGFQVKLEDYQWVYYHSFLTQDDYLCRFKVPLSQFRVKPKPARFIKMKLRFEPDGGGPAIEAERRVWVP